MTSEEKAQALQHTLGSRGWQDVIKPALKLAIDVNVQHLVTGSRPKGEESVTDDALKNRIIALKWVLDWESRTKVLIEQMAAVERARQEAEDMGEGGSPY